MICVSLGLTRHTNMIEQHSELARHKVGLVELRLDCLKRAVQLERLLPKRPTPVVVTARRTQDGGFWPESEDKRIMLLRSAIAQGVEWVDLEEDIAGGIPRFGKTKRIVSYHNVTETPADLEAIRDRLAKLNADLVRIVTRPRSIDDVWRLLRVMQSASVPTIAVGTSDLGVPTQVLSRRCGAPFAIAAFHYKRPMFDGQLGYDELHRVFRADGLAPESEVYALATPKPATGPSACPAAAVMNRAFAQLGLNKVLVPFLVRPDEFPAFLHGAQQFGVKGASIAGELRRQAFGCVAKADHGATESEMVDTIVCGADVAGYHLLSRAVVENAIVGLGIKTTEDQHTGLLAGKSAVILGSGAMARVAAFGLRGQGAELTISGRTIGTAQDLAVRIGGQVRDWVQRGAGKPDVLVNCTPVGQFPEVDATPLPKSDLHRSTVVLDCVYNPDPTLLVKDAKQQGCTAIGGASVFLRHAVLQFRAFTGQKAPLDEMKETFKRATGVAQVN